MPLITAYNGGARGYGFSSAKSGFSVPAGYNTTNLVQHFDAAVPSSYPGSGTTVYDLSGNNNNGTLVNGVSWTNVGIPTFNFDGTNDFINTTLAVTRGGPNTLDMWVKLSPGWSGYLHGVGGWYSTYYAFYGYTFDSADYIAMTSFGGGGSALTHTYNVANPGWINITMVYNYPGSPKKALYLNGSLVASNNLAESVLENSLGMTWGAYKSSGSSTMTEANAVFGGYVNFPMAVMARYHRVLSSAEITSNYNAYRTRFGI